MTVARHFGADLTKSLPYLWENTIGPLRAVVTEAQCVGKWSEWRLDFTPPLVQPFKWTT